MRRNKDIDFIILDGAAGILCDKYAITLNIYAAAQRDDGGIDCNRAAFCRGCAGCRLRTGYTVAGSTRAVEGQLVTAKREDE